MRTIAFVTQKGGSGKSTLASSLAVTAMEAGERVFIIDLDPQASLVKWSKMRGEVDVPVEAVTPAKLTTALATLAKNGVTLCIIDTAGAESPTANAAMKAADLCIIPSRPNVFDLWASEQTRKSLRDMNKPFVFLLNQCPPSRVRVWTKASRLWRPWAGLFRPSSPPASIIRKRRASAMG